MNGSDPLDSLLRLMQALRDPASGCPWDLKQDFASIAPHTLEEAYEVIDAIEQGDMTHLRDELGDLLFQIVFYAQLGAELGLFDFMDIASAVTEKLLRRHPHIFPDGSLESAGTANDISAEQVSFNWEKIKQQERGKTEARQSLLDDVPIALPALTRAAKLQKRAASAGFDWSNTRQVLDKLDEEKSELVEALATGEQDAVDDELGDLLFSAVNICRHLGKDPEQLLRRGNSKFESRFRAMETLARVRGTEFGLLTIDQQEQLWQECKQLQASLVADEEK